MDMSDNLKENSGAKLTFGLIKHWFPFSEICFHDNRLFKKLFWV